MIRYSLKCAGGHTFEAWFASGAAFDAQRAKGQAACPECGETDVEKALMAPRVPAKAAAQDHPLARLRAEIERKADYVGPDFAKRARAMHDGTEAHRPIYGEAAPREVRALVDDGVPVAPLPFIPKRKTN